MRLVRQNVGIPLLLVLIMLLDGQISTFLANILPLNLHLVCHLLLIFLLFVSVEISDTTTFIIFLIIGVLYDAYYFHVIGIATLLLPLLSLLVNKYNATMMQSRLTRLLSILVLVFLFEFVSFVLGNLVGLTGLDMGAFVVYSLAPSILWNCLLLLFLQPLLEKVYL